MLKLVTKLFPGVIKFLLRALDVKEILAIALNILLNQSCIFISVKM